MRSTALVLTLTALAAAPLAAGCIFADEDVGDSTDAGTHADAMFDPIADAHEADGGDPLPCSQDLVCPPPAAGKFQICGRIYDLETSANVVDAPASALEVRFYDAIVLSMGGNKPALLTVHPDSCGRFTAGTGLTPPQLGYIAVAVDDAGQDVGTGSHVVTARLVASAPNATAEHVRAYSARETTDATWSGTMSPSLATQGAFVGIYVDTNRPAVAPYDGTPVTGVQVTFDGASAPANDLYFSDLTPTARSVVGNGSATGSNGSGIRTLLMLGTSFGGIGPAGCTWLEAPAFTIPGAIVVTEFESACSP